MNPTKRAAILIARIILEMNTTGRLAKALSNLVLVLLDPGVDRRARLRDAGAKMRLIEPALLDARSKEAIKSIDDALATGRLDSDASQNLELNEPMTFQDVLAARSMERDCLEEMGMLRYAEDDARLTASVERNLALHTHLEAAENAVQRSEDRPTERSAQIHNALRALIRATRALAPLVLVALLGACSPAEPAPLPQPQPPTDTCAVLGRAGGREVYLCEGADLRCGVITTGFGRTESAAISCVDSTLTKEPKL